MKKHLIALLVFLSTASIVFAEDNLMAFPQAEEGMARFVLDLPKQTDESDLKVELIVGRTVEIDPRNNYFFSGEIETETVAGWGFTSYKVRKIGPMAGTLMAVDSNEAKAARFITLGIDPYLIRYNSRVPIVMYVPEDAEVRYRIWSADSEMKKIDKG